jgi:hypothetical protein
VPIPAAPAVEPPAPAAEPSAEPPKPSLAVRYEVIDTPERRKLLEIDADVPLSADLIRRQYSRLAERYAPEKVALMGPEVVALVRTKSDAVRAAASALLESLGETLEQPPPTAESEALRHNPDLDALFGP